MNYYTSPSDRRTKPVEGIETIPGPEGMGNVQIVRGKAPEWALVDFDDVDAITETIEILSDPDTMSALAEADAELLHIGGCSCHRRRYDWDTPYESEGWAAGFIDPIQRREDWGTY